MNQYSRPCCSWPRGAREVCEIETASRASSSSSALTRLDLPAPLGAATTKRLPGYSMDALIRCSGPVRASARSRLSFRRRYSSVQGPPIWSPGYWLRGAIPGSGNPAACRARRLFSAAGSVRRGGRAAGRVPRPRRCGWRMPPLRSAPVPARRPAARWTRHRSRGGLPANAPESAAAGAPQRRAAGVRPRRRARAAGRFAPAGWRPVFRPRARATRPDLRRRPWPPPASRHRVPPLRCRRSCTSARPRARTADSPAAARP
mmetsp:Transcript_60043/g.142154  ORF Transcript_60043/g.142154 Transcript_60043/m.142154 type:complete len:260 (-) Transcript_60043:529-1308(-)